MPLIVEDGSGKPDADVFADATYVTAYWAKRGGNAVWSANTAQQDAGCVEATEYLCTGLFDWLGTAHPTARLTHPRLELTERNGNPVPSTIVHWRVKDAMARLAPRAIEAMLNGTTLLPPVDRGGRILSESLSGVASVTYDPKAPAYAVQQDVMGLLWPLLRDPTRGDDVVPQWVGVPGELSEDPAMRADTFRNPGAW